MKPFGTTARGERVDAITLSDHGLTVTILTLGAIVQDVRLDGVDYNLTLGSDRLADYEDTMQFHGSIVAPVANRISNASAVIDDVTHNFERNLLGKHTLHSGSAGTQAKVWRVQDVTGAALTLTHDMPDGEGGFPANRVITATFEILSGPELRLTITTTTDAPSIANATNHSYWNLDGTDHIHDHRLRIQGTTYLPNDADGITSGEIVAVHATPFDFQVERPLIPNAPPLDNTFCLDPHRDMGASVMTLTGASGISVRVATSEPGLHVYDARTAQRPTGPFYEGIAIEAQGWPDAPNKPTFPSIAIAPDAPAVQITQWRFTKL